MQSLYKICSPRLVQCGRIPLGSSCYITNSRVNSLTLCKSIGLINSRNVCNDNINYSGRRFSSSLNNSVCHKQTNTLNHRQLLAINQIKSMSLSSSSMGKDEDSIRSKYEPRERKFKTVYGHIAGLEWGNPDAPNKILCIHGWLDNAGSFERLIPYILDHEDNANKYHFVAIDQPGCGLSSHKPPGAEYTMFTTVIEMRRVVKELGWEKLSLLSHSMGSQISFLFASIYPYQVKNLMSIDLLHPIAAGLKNWAPILVSSIEELLKMEEVLTDDPTTNIQVPVYSREDAIKRLMDGHNNSLTRESAEVMLKRGARKEQWGYTFNRDLRHRIMYVEFRMDYELQKKYVSDFFSSNLLVIQASKSVIKIPKETTDSFDEIFRKNCRLFRKVGIEGTHHLHMNIPDKVAAIVCQYLTEAEDLESKVKLEKFSDTSNKSKL